MRKPEKSEIEGSLIDDKGKQPYPLRLIVFIGL